MDNLVDWDSWLGVNALAEQALRDRLVNSYRAHARRVQVFPSEPHLFRALSFFPINECRVCILGQDPYHGPQQADGLAFSVPPTLALPPSLRNIYKELEADLGVRRENGSLVGWARQGVLLLNSHLSVEQGQPASHAGWGWEGLTDHIVCRLASARLQVAFLLWGAHAQKKEAQIKAVSPKAKVFKSAHPSPLSAYRGFFGSRPFSAINHHLVQTGQTPVDWAG